MRFIHTADLHIGKRLGGLSLEGDMAHLLGWLADLVMSEQADALVVAGDVFDAPIPPESAVSMWDGFVCRMAERGVCLMAIGGNHDSGVRLGYGARLAKDAGVHVAGELTGDVPRVVCEDVTFWLLPFVRPADVRAWGRARGSEVEGPLSYDDAVRLVLDDVRARPEYAESCRNVLVAHQFVTAGGSEPDRSDSERMSLGTLDNVDAHVFDGFDYVALGHVHRPQRVGRETLRYAGSPLAFSTSEVPYPKSVAVVDMARGAEPGIRCVPVEPLHAFRVERGAFDELKERGAAESEDRRQDYVAACVTDDDEPLDVAQRLRSVWANLVGVTFDNARTAAAGAAVAATTEVDDAELPELFSEFYEDQAGQPLTADEQAVVASTLDEALGGEAR
ncbi:MAG: exonuclease SbcCD subunit D [Atopobiaceae bacterium]|nr:exonuclease SbcCD subunit D [Atopobiaceae bacterium]MCH4179821.1 exonuclease SbcCD subunit D [Atopobiaceae bacterium]MCH4213572.1 exonuclease SbcCD subunit D [Atopobiaceae bacterium]MCH4230041.1 exonuclease SbcCD subunit D [Atopobiaceae bacterium]MCH4276220.1 exonuclease SbcCD subunit D [Atopobiaceae bacterium]